MAKQTLNIGSVANDGTGTNLRSGGTIINANFNEIYTALGNGTTITLTATPTELNLLSGATAIVTTTNAVTLTNKTLALGSNTISGTTAQFNTALTDGDFVTLAGTENLTNKNLNSATNTFPTISIRDDSSSAISIALGGTLKLKSNDGITTTVSQGDTITISLDSNILTETSTDTLTNKSISLSTNTITGTIAQFNTAVSDADLATLAGSETLTNKTISGSSNTLSNIANGSLTNSSITLGSTSTSLGGTTTSIAGLSLTGSANTIDLTSSGNKLRFNFANSGALPAAATYAGMFATTTGTAKAFFADSGGWNEIASENSSINLFTDVDLVTAAPTGKQTLSWVSASGKFIPATLGATTLLTGDGSTVNFTINNLYTVNNILVFVNGICLEPTNDYTVSGTTLTFVTAPVSAASIMIRYLG